MKKLFVSTLLLVIGISLFGCASNEPVDTEDIEDQAAAVHLTSEAGGDYLPLRASFMSDGRTMAYTFDYDGNLMAMVDTPFEGASEYGASFKVEGGGEITTSTYPLSGFVPPVDKVLNACSYSYEFVQDTEEVLLLQLRVCEGEDAELGAAALYGLLDGLMIESL